MKKRVTADERRYTQMLLRGESRAVFQIACAATEVCLRSSAFIGGFRCLRGVCPALVGRRPVHYAGGMSDAQLSMRPFRPEDAAFCFRVRARAFIVDFIDEVGPEIAALCVNAYMPADYVRMTQDREVFVVECDGERAGFFTLKKRGADRAELVLIYIDHRQRGKGIGSWCLGEIESWIRDNWPEVNTLYLDTIIPASSGGFYRRQGFAEVGKDTSSFGDVDVPCARFAKSV